MGNKALGFTVEQENTIWEMWRRGIAECSWCSRCRYDPVRLLAVGAVGAPPIHMGLQFVMTAGCGAGES